MPRSRQTQTSPAHVIRPLVSPSRNLCHGESVSVGLGDRSCVSLKAFIISEDHCNTVCLCHRSEQNKTATFQVPEGDRNVEQCLKTVENFAMMPQ